MTAPGLYPHLSFAEYAAIDAINAHSLMAYLESPQLYRDQQTGVAQRRETPSQQFGTSAHMGILEPTRYKSLRAIEPATYPGAKGEDKQWTYAANYCKAWRAEQTAAGRVVVSADDDIRIQTMHERMPDDLRPILTAVQTTCEIPIVAHLRGVLGKGRLDVLDAYNDTVYEFKTVSHIGQAEKHVHKLRYFVQAQWYRELAAAHYQRSFQVRIVFAETAAPYRWRILELDPDYIALARQQIGSALAGILERRRTGDWSDPGDVHEIISPPVWMVEDEDLDEEEVA